MGSEETVLGVRRVEPGGARSYNLGNFRVRVNWGLDKPNGEVRLTRASNKVKEFGAIIDNEGNDSDLTSEELTNGVPILKGQRIVLLGTKRSIELVHSSD